MLLCNRLPPDAMDRLSDDTLNVSALPAGVGEIIAKALAIKPPRRFQSAAEMRQAVILADGGMPTKMVQPLSTTVADTSSWPVLPAQPVRSAPCIQVWPAASDATSMDVAAMLIICITVIFGIALALQSWFGYEATMAFLFNGTPLPDAVLATKAALLFGGLTLGVIVTLVMCIRWRAWLWAMMLVLPAFYLVLTTAGLIASAFGVTAL